jgi:hypothetical protein
MAEFPDDFSWEKPSIRRDRPASEIWACLPALPDQSRGQGQLHLDCRVPSGLTQPIRGGSVLGAVGFPAVI